MHAAHIAVWNQRSIDSRKRLRLRIVHDIEVIKETIQKQVADDCRQLLRDLDSTSATSQANSNMMLGESANSYNEFLALKNAIEKLVTSYSTSTQRYIVMSQEKSSNGENDRVFSEELNVLRSEILRSYLILRLQRSLEMGENWLHGFNDLVNNTTNRKESLKSQIQALQVNLCSSNLSSHVES